MAKKSDDFQLIESQIRSGQFAPVYILHGDESYFIDRITDLLLEQVVPEEARDFDLTQFYAGAGTFTLGEVITACRRYPMVSGHQLVLLREAQAFDKRSVHLDDLALYLRQPSPTTVFVLTHKVAAITGATELLRLARKIGVVYQSDHVPDYNLSRELPSFIASLGFKAQPEAVDMLASYIGSDFARLAQELEKLRVGLQGRTEITARDVADHVGISRDYNVFELVEAIAGRDALRVETIRRYFARNPKAGPTPMVISSLFTFFQNLMLSYYAPSRSDAKALMSSVGLSYPQAKNVIKAMNHYNARVTMRNISILRDYDARSKGGRGLSLPDAELQQQLFYQLMH